VISSDIVKQTGQRITFFSGSVERSGKNSTTASSNPEGALIYRTSEVKDN
jgi:hypothetical protein